MKYGRGLEERFWEKVDIRGPDDCWEWLAGKDSGGYGAIKSNGKQLAAHRASWEIHNGPIPEGLCVCHRCGNKGCVNPLHLALNATSRIKTVEERFWEKVDKCGPDDCWEWIGAKTSAGYGSFGINQKTFQAQRVAWELVNGAIPGGEGYHGICICHHCDNRSCVNPAHLFLGTVTDNMQDMYAKGRNNNARGEAQGGAKLTEQDVREIRLFLKAGYAQKDIAFGYGVSGGAIYSISINKSWSWLK